MSTSKYKDFQTIIYTGKDEDILALTKEEILVRAIDNNPIIKYRREDIENLTVEAQIYHYHDCYDDYYHSRTSECDYGLQVTVKGKIPYTEKELKQNALNAERQRKLREAEKKKKEEANRKAKAREIKRLKDKLAKDPELRKAIGLE